MCYRISCVVEMKEVADLFPDLVFDEQIDMNFDAAVHIHGHNYGDHPIIYKNREDWKPHIKLMEWGCIPYRVTNEEAYSEYRKTMLVARSEKILDDPKSYWYEIKSRRCLIPLNGFYEHKAEAGFSHKIPYYIHLKHQSTFFVPGLYSVAELEDKVTGKKERRWTFAMITRAANSKMREIHNSGDFKWRMPLLLPFALADKYVRKNLSESEYREILNFEMPSEELDGWPVYTLGGVRPDGKEANDYYEWVKEPELPFEEYAFLISA